MNILFHDKRDNKLVVVEDASDELIGLAELLLEVSTEQLVDEFVCAMDDNGYDASNLYLGGTTLVVSV
jgi:archaellum biogenesis ATPase FlaH